MQEPAAPSRDLVAPARARVAALAVECQRCGKPTGFHMVCPVCDQVQGLPDGVELSSYGKRFGKELLELVLLIVTALVGWLVWSLVVYRRGQTPAKQLLGMRVFNTQQGRVASWGTMFVRELVLKTIVGYLTGLLGSLWIFFGDNRQELWDLPFKTIVVNDRAGRTIGLSSPVLTAPVVAALPVRTTVPSGATQVATTVALSGVTRVAVTDTPARHCPDCAEEIDANAAFCPFCGYAIKDAREPGRIG